MEAEAGELLTDRPGLRVALLAETEDLSVSHALVASGGPFPPPHVHRRHADCFLVTGGAVSFRLGEAERVVEAESWVQVPAGIVHTFAPAGDGPAAFVNVHTPSCGYGEFVRGLAAATDRDELRRVRESFDQAAKPPVRDSGPGEGVWANREVPPAAATICRLGGDEGEAITDGPNRRVTLLADSEEAGVTESVYGPGERGPDPHVHREHTDSWLVLDGVLTFELRGGKRFEAAAGTLVVVPPHVTHSFWNEGEETARFLNLHTPSCGFGAYLHGRNPGFDQHDPPPDGGADPASVLVRRLS
ncbi:MAG TPA: cupin domain-containing protein [Gaiellaceae bacterium]|nr:cupin domain-containing protein [Gaiellaceae bacterium]